MDIITYSVQLQEQLKQEIEIIRGNKVEGPESAAGMVRACEGILTGLREFVQSYTFADRTEEILFFKERKPVLMAQYLYHKAIFSMALHGMYASVDQSKAHYQTFLDRMGQYARKHRAFFYYCMSGDKSRDHEYFVRRSSKNILFRDVTFSTKHDHLLATMLSDRLLLDYINDRLRNLNTVNAFESRLNWTANKTDLIELLYALHVTGCINDGQAEVKQIATTFEAMFNIKLGNYYDYLKKISQRKTGQTAFLNTLRDKLLRRLEQLDE